MKIVFIRHGQTDWNVAGKLQGTEDIPLNDTGRMQALHCARYLTNTNWDKIYTSPLNRAFETAQILSDALQNQPVNVHPDFIERDFGVASGMTNKELRTQFTDYPNTSPSGMEPFIDLCKRITFATKDVAKQNPDENILIVSHGGTTNALLYDLSGGKIGTGITFLKNTGICQFQYNSVDHSLAIVHYNLSPKEFSDL